MMGGAWFNEVFGSNPSLADVENIAVQSTNEQLNLKSDPVNVRAQILTVSVRTETSTNPMFVRAL